MEMKVLAASEEREKVLAASKGRGEREKVLAASEGRGEEMNPPNEVTSREYDNSGDQVGPFFITQQHFF